MGALRSALIRNLELVLILHHVDVVLVAADTGPATVVVTTGQHVVEHDLVALERSGLELQRLEVEGRIGPTTAPAQRPGEAGRRTSGRERRAEVVDPSHQVGQGLRS